MSMLLEGFDHQWSPIFGYHGTVTYKVNVFLTRIETVSFLTKTSFFFLAEDSVRKYHLRY